MSIRKAGLAISVFLLFVFAGACAQTLDDVLQKHYVARGGLENIKAIQTLYAEGKMSRMGMELAFLGYQKKPNKLRTEVTIQGQKIVQAFDGKSGWMIMPMMGSPDPQDSPEEMTKQLEEQADLDGFLVDWKEKGHKVELVGKEDVEGTDSYHIKVTTKNDKIRDIYLDGASYLEIKQKGKVTQQGQEIEVESLPGSYKQVNGVMMAFSVETKVRGQAIGQMVIDTVIVNKEIPDSLFVKPAAKK
jgi:outer membrane lipoprotein-sorting protein